MGDLANVKNTLPAEMQDVFDADSLAGDLYDGVQGGFAVISIRGSRFRIAKAGEETVMLNEKDEPIGSLECVLVKASRNVSKLYYAKSFEEGDDAAPDCWSIDGITPDAGATTPQSSKCATCPQNVWGSKITPAGKKTKACGDNRRIAVVPLGDIENKQYDGAMMLRVPAASLADLALYGKGMAGKGFPYNAIGTRIGFDTSASFPKLTFKPIRPLTEAELIQVAEVAMSPTVNAILDAPPTEAAPTPEPTAEPEAAVSLDFEQEEGDDVDAVTAEMEGKAPPKKKAAVKKKAAAKKPEPEPEPAEEEAAADPVEESLDDLLADLDSLG